jgi:hypothetical protein
VASTLAGIVGVLLIIWMIRLHLPSMLVIYSAGIVILALGSGFGGSVPRFLLSAFPIFLALAARLRSTFITLLIGLSGAGLAVLMLVVELTRTVTP